SFLHFHDIRYEIGALVVMGNHCHLTMRPFDGFDLEKELGAIKRTTSRFVYDREATSDIPHPCRWQDESYDRILRDEEHLYRVIQYIGRNPYADGIEKSRWHRWINPVWRQAKWDFEVQ
ncbi:MAG: transposase, partial [Pirellulaceae bacterium]